MNNIIESLGYGWRSRRAWWFTATSRARARFARTALGGFWLGLSNLLSTATLSLVYGTVFKVQDFYDYVVFLGTGLVVWNTIAAAIGSAPVLFETNAIHLKNTNLHPIFYTLEEWAFQAQTFFQSFIMVLFGLSFFKHDLFLNLFWILRFINKNNDNKSILQIMQIIVIINTITCRNCISIKK